MFLSVCDRAFCMCAYHVFAQFCWVDSYRFVFVTDSAVFANGGRWLRWRVHIWLVPFTAVI